MYTLYQIHTNSVNWRSKANQAENRCEEQVIYTKQVSWEVVREAVSERAGERVSEKARRLYLLMCEKEVTPG